MTAMSSISRLYADLYIERFGDPEDPEPEEARQSPVASEGFAVRVLQAIFRRRLRKRASAWSFTLPIDRRLR